MLIVNSIELSWIEMDYAVVLLQQRLQQKGLMCVDG